jgi:hypothetical protein
MNISDKVLIESKDNNTEIILKHEAGFFSLCTVTLEALLAQGGKSSTHDVSWPAQNAWRNPTQCGTNLFTQYFSPTMKMEGGGITKRPENPAHGIYTDIDYNRLIPYINHFFQPSPIVLERKEFFKKKYSIIPEETIAVCYRGTDKWIEVSPIPPGYYWTQVRRLQKRNPHLRVMIQTDQQEVLREGLKDFAPNVFNIEELPVTSGGIVMHNLDQEKRGISNFDLGVNLLAAITLLSECHYVITHTGNVGYWIMLYRGHAKNTCQLIPSPPIAVSRLPSHNRMRAAVARLLRFLQSA